MRTFITIVVKVFHTSQREQDLPKIEKKFSRRHLLVLIVSLLIFCICIVCFCTECVHLAASPQKA